MDSWLAGSGTQGKIMETEPLHITPNTQENRPQDKPLSAETSRQPPICSIEAGNLVRLHPHQHAAPLIPPRSKLGHECRSSALQQAAFCLSFIVGVRLLIDKLNSEECSVEPLGLTLTVTTVGMWRSTRICSDFFHSSGSICEHPVLNAAARSGLA